MKKILCLALVFILALSCVLANGSSEDGGKEKVYNLKISTSQTETSLIAKAYMTFADRINEESNGRINASVFCSAQLGNDEDVIEQAIQGAAIAVNTDAARLGTYVDPIGILMMGFFVDSYDEAYAVTQSKTFNSYLEELADKHGIRVLAFDFYDGPRHFMTNVPINSPADLKGLSIRTIGSPVTIESIRAMGATPISMAWSEVYNGIQSKAIDGCEAQNTSIYPSKLYEVAKYQSKTGHFHLLQALMVGEKWYQSLPEDLQQLLVKVANEVGKETAQLVIDEADRVEALLKEAGLTVIEPDTAPFKEAVEKAYEKLGYLELRNKIYDEIGKAY